MMKFKEEYRNRLYYNRYTYKIYATVKFSSAIRYVNTFSQLVKTLPTNMDAIALKELQILFDVINTIKTSKECKIRKEFNTYSIFSNDLAILTAIQSKLPVFKLTKVILLEKQITKVKLLKNPTHEFRVHFNRVRLTPELEDDIKKSVRENPTLKPSPSLRNYCNRGFRCFTSSRWYFDFKSESHSILLRLLLGDALSNNAFKLEKKVV